MIKRIFAVAAVTISITLSYVCMCFTASAEEGEATWTLNNTHYTVGTLKEGLEAMTGSDSGIMMLNSDFTISETLDFSDGTCIIDLDGHTLKLESSGLNIGEEAAVSIVDGKGTGSIIMENQDEGGFVFNVLGTLNFQSGKIVAESDKPVAVKSTGTLVIGSDSAENAAEIGRVEINGGELRLIGSKGVTHKISGIKIAEQSNVTLDCAVTVNSYDATSEIKAGYESSNELLIVDISEKAAVTAAESGTYKGHTISAAEIMGIDDNMYDQTLYSVITAAAAVILIALIWVLTVIVLKKRKKRSG